MILRKLCLMLIVATSLHCFAGGQDQSKCPPQHQDGVQLLVRLSPSDATQEAIKEPEDDSSDSAKRIFLATKKAQDWGCSPSKASDGKTHIICVRLGGPDKTENANSAGERPDEFPWGPENANVDAAGSVYLKESFGTSIRASLKNNFGPVTELEFVPIPKVEVSLAQNGIVLQSSRRAKTLSAAGGETLAVRRQLTNDGSRLAIAGQIQVDIADPRAARLGLSNRSSVTPMLIGVFAINSSSSVFMNAGYSLGHTGAGSCALQLAHKISDKWSVYTEADCYIPTANHESWSVAAPVSVAYNITPQVLLGAQAGPEKIQSTKGIAAFFLLGVKMKLNGPADD